MIDGTRPGSVEPGDARSVDRGAGTTRRSLRNDYSSADYPNASAASARKWSSGKPCYQFNNLQNMPDNATQYCPSVSTISIVDSEDEGTLPYALKRIQRDFPSQWKHHPLGRSYDDMDWHQDRPRLYDRSFRGGRDPSITISVPVRVRSILKSGPRSTRGEESPQEKKVRWDDDPRVGNIRRSEMFKLSENNIARNSRAAGRYTPGTPLSPTYPPRWWDS